jgi:predicted Zn-dependent peptidase
LVKLLKCAAVLLVACLCRAQDLKEFEKHVTEFTLDNGLHFIVLQRSEAPVVSFHTYVNAGAVDDPQGKTGLAHMFEHMAFKGTAEIGSKSWAEERQSMAQVERVYDQLDAERARGELENKERITALQADLKGAVEKAATYVDTNLYPRIIEENGGEGLNANTGEDSTQFFYSLPSNRAELWFLLESARFKAPVYREFYKERDVVRQERRMRTENEPQGQLIEALGATAIEAQPYRRPAIGWPSDIENLRVSDAEKFFATYYVPANITIAIVGDIDPATAHTLAEKYFGPIPKGPLPAGPTTQDPPRDGVKTVEVESAAQPIEFISYNRPSQYDKDDPVFDVISSVLSGGRTGLLYKSLVRDQRVALAAGADSSYPGSKYPNLFILYVAPTMGKTLPENEKALTAVLDTLKNQKVDEQTLARVKTKVRADLIRQLDNNSGLASLLSTYQANYGDWRKLFTSIDEINHVTADDVQRVARTYFVDKYKTVAYLKAPAGAAPAGAAQ